MISAVKSLRAKMKISVIPLCNSCLFTPLLVLLLSGFSGPARAQIMTGLDRVADYATLFSGRHIGIITNHTAYNQQGLHIVDVFAEMPDVQITALFGPEHGIRGQAAAGQKIDSTSDPLKNIPIYSLYGRHRKPTAKMLAGVDMLVFDIQDVGARFYTYIWTMALAMEAAAEQGIPFVVLDRPNPINGTDMEGPLLEKEYATFVGLYPIPVRHGMTAGELAALFNGQGWLKNGVRADLKVIPMKGWWRSMWYDDTGLTFIKPSPNMPNLETAAVYPGMCLLEGVNVSEGRGTFEPFLQFGAPWISAADLIHELNDIDLPGVEFTATRFVPESIPGMAGNPLYLKQTCFGLKLEVTDRTVFKPFWTGVQVVAAVHKIYGDRLEFRQRHFDRLAGTDKLRRAILQNKDLKVLYDSWEDQLNEFRKLRRTYLFYE